MPWETSSPTCSLATVCYLQETIELTSWQLFEDVWVIVSKWRCFMIAWRILTSWWFCFRVSLVHVQLFIWYLFRSLRNHKWVWYFHVYFMGHAGWNYSLLLNHAGVCWPSNTLLVFRVLLNPKRHYPNNNNNTGTVHVQSEPDALPVHAGQSGPKFCFRWNNYRKYVWTHWRCSGRSRRLDSVRHFLRRARWTNTLLSMIISHACVCVRTYMYFVRMHTSAHIFNIFLMHQFGR